MKYFIHTTIILIIFYNILAVCTLYGDGDEIIIEDIREFVDIYQEKTAPTKELWDRKYSKMILNRKCWEIQMKKIKSQGQRPDCAPTCIAMICDYYNIEHDPHWKIGRRMRASVTGTSIIGIVRELENSGLKVCVYPGTIEDIKNKIETGTPVIVAQQHTDKIRWGHARIVIGFNDMTEEFTVIDPNFGNRKSYLKYEDFLMLWKRFYFCTILAFK